MNQKHTRRHEVSMIIAKQYSRELDRATTPLSGWRGGDINIKPTLSMSRVLWCLQRGMRSVDK